MSLPRVCHQVDRNSWLATRSLKTSVGWLGRYGCPASGLFGQDQPVIAGQTKAIFRAVVDKANFPGTTQQGVDIDPPKPVRQFQRALIFFPYHLRVYPIVLPFWLGFLGQAMPRRFVYKASFFIANDYQYQIVTNCRKPPLHSTIGEQKYGLCYSMSE